MSCSTYGSLTIYQCHCPTLIEKLSTPLFLPLTDYDNDDGDDATTAILVPSLKLLRNEGYHKR